MSTQIFIMANYFIDSSSKKENQAISSLLETQSKTLGKQSI